jgi:hypothetical protein
MALLMSLGGLSPSERIFLRSSLRQVFKKVEFSCAFIISKRKHVYSLKLLVHFKDNET